MTAFTDAPDAPARWLPRLPVAFVVAIALHGAAAVYLGLTTAYPFDPGMASMLATLLGVLMPLFLLAMLLYRVWRLAVVEKSTRPIGDLLGALGDLARDRERLIGGATKFVLAAFFIGASAYLKDMITVLKPFSWDATFAAWDRALHFGTDPWRITFAAFGTPLATTALNGAYHLWFFAIYFCVFAACFAPVRHHASAAFLVAFVLTFAVGGNLLATVFSSAGPVYYERLGLGADFAPLMARLADFHEVSPVWALAVQEALWLGYAAEGRLSGISAMPSMHVATTVLMAFYAFSWRRWAGWMMAAFAGAIMVGSVHLGWHYAVDGYLGAVVAWAAWRAGHLLVRRY